MIYIIIVLFREKRQKEGLNEIMSRFRNVEQEMAQLANEDSTMGDTTSQQSDAEWGAAAAALHEDDDDEELNEKVQ